VRRRLLLGVPVRGEGRCRRGGGGVLHTHHSSSVLLRVSEHVQAKGGTEGAHRDTLLWGNTGRILETIPSRRTQCLRQSYARTDAGLK